MSKNTFPVNGGAMSNADRKAVMTRAWAIFRRTYSYPQIKFASIGRRCFASCLRAAWAEYRQVRDFAAIPAKAKRARIKVLQRQIALAQYADSYRTTQRIEAACRAEIAALSQGREVRAHT
jgi:uncharacterized iron-regulated protein